MATERSSTPTARVSLIPWRTFWTVASAPPMLFTTAGITLLLALTLASLLAATLAVWPALERNSAIALLGAALAGGTALLAGWAWLFDTDLHSSMIAQLLESVEGVERVEEVQLFEYDLRSGRRLGSGRDSLRLKPHSLFLSARHQVVAR